MMDHVDKTSTLNQAKEPAPPGADGSLPTAVITADILSSEGYNPLLLLQDQTAAQAAIIISCPHAGRDYPASMTDKAALDVAEMRGLEDFAVDHLLGDLPANGITCVINRVARAFIDVNRAAGALDSAMFDTPIDADKPSRQVTAGYGLIPRLSAKRDPLYNTSLPAEEVDRRLGLVYRPYHDMLASQIASREQEFGHCLLVDVHSMPPRDRTNRLLADIILGDCLDITLDRDKAKSITEFFNGEGLRVVWNDPYAGGYITRAHGKAGTPRQAVQIEINRALYMRDKAMAVGTPKLDISKARQITRLMGRFGAYLVKMQTAAA